MPRRKAGRPPGSGHKSKHIPEDTVWFAVKRIERATKELPEMLTKLQDEVTKLRQQVQKANEVIIRLVEDSRKTTDYDTLRQQNHAYDRRTH